MHQTSEQKGMAVWETLLRTVSALLRTFEQELQESDALPLAWFDVLIQLYEAPERGLRMQALADSVVLSRSGLTRLIDRMERAGLVRREPSREDRRGYYAVITDEGLRVIGLARPEHHRGIREHFINYLDDNDIEALDIALSKVRAHLQ